MFDLDSELKPLPHLAAAIIRNYTRILYKHITLVDTNNKPFNAVKVNDEIARTFMSRILAYQLYRRNYLNDKIYTNTPTHRSNREVRLMKLIGELDYDTGVLILNKRIIKLLKRAKAWTDFIKATKP